MSWIWGRIRTFHDVLGTWKAVYVLCSLFVLLPSLYSTFFSVYTHSHPSQRKSIATHVFNLLSTVGAHFAERANFFRCCDVLFVTACSLPHLGLFWGFCSRLFSHLPFPHPLSRVFFIPCLATLLPVSFLARSGVPASTIKIPGHRRTCNWWRLGLKNLRNSRRSWWSRFCIWKLS